MICWDFGLQIDCSKCSGDLGHAGSRSNTASWDSLAAGQMVGSPSRRIQSTFQSGPELERQRSTSLAAVDASRNSVPTR